ncbi:MAG: glycosyltransferase [Patescibacteria group bacterium]|jgi:glycosyltransferase involved in cell wall biosynthesis
MAKSEIDLGPKPRQIKSVLMVIPYFAPAWSYGGVVRVAYNQACELVKRGIKVTVATSDAGDAPHRINKTAETIDGIQIVRFRNPSNNLAKFHNFYLPFGFAGWMKKNVKNFDVVHCHDYFTVQNIITSRVCVANDVPYVVQPHGVLSLVSRQAKLSWVKTTFIRLFHRIVDRANAVIALSPKELSDISVLYPSVKSKVVVVTNGVDPLEFLDVPKVNLVQKFDLAPESKVISFVGRIQYIKGLDIAFQVIKQLKKPGMNVVFLIIGPDEGEKANLDKLALELKISDNVIYTGLLSGKEKLSVVKSSDLFLLMSRSEGIPMTVLEASALGVPVVCSKDCNLPEIEQMGVGRVVDDVGSAVEAASQILSNTDLQKTLQKNTVRFVDHFSLSNSVSKLIKTYQI